MLNLYVVMRSLIKQHDRIQWVVICLSMWWESKLLKHHWKPAVDITGQII